VDSLSERREAGGRGEESLRKEHRVEGNKTHVKWHAGQVTATERQIPTTEVHTEAGASLFFLL
jgi:hypothetical protein